MARSVFWRETERSFVKTTFGGQEYVAILPPLLLPLLPLYFVPAKKRERGGKGTVITG
jgi:hypothetical protein